MLSLIPSKFRTNFLDAAAKRLKSALDDAGAAYAAVHGAKQPRSPSEFKPSQYPGLLFCHTVKNGSSEVLFSYWQSEQSFRTSSGPFADELGDGGPATCEGAVANYYLKKDSWWNRFPFWTVVITASALIGAITALWQSGAQLLEAPDITVDFSQDNPRNVLEAEAPRIKLTVTNQCRFASAAVKIGAHLAGAGGAGELQRNRFSRIEPGASKDFIVSEPFPETSSRTEGPPVYELQVEAISKAGLGRRERKFGFTSPKLYAWKVLANTTPAVRRFTGDACETHGYLYSGRAQTITTVVVVPFRTELQSVVTTVGGFAYVPAKPSPSGKVIRQEFDITGLRAFQPYEYTVVARAPGMQEAACQQMSKSMEIYFREKTGAQR